MQNARELYQKYLAFTPWPGVFLENGLKFLELELVDELKQNAKMGEILELEKESFCLLANKEFCVLKTSRKWKKLLMVGLI